MLPLLRGYAAGRHGAVRPGPASGRRRARRRRDRHGRAVTARALRLQPVRRPRGIPARERRRADLPDTRWCCRLPVSRGRSTICVPRFRTATAWSMYQRRSLRLRPFHHSRCGRNSMPSAARLRAMAAIHCGPRRRYRLTMSRRSCSRRARPVRHSHTRRRGRRCARGRRRCCARSARRRAAPRSSARCLHSTCSASRRR